MKPVIGYTKGHKKFDILSWAIHLSIWIAGGRAEALKSGKPQYGLEIDGLIIAGGTDISPARYKQEPEEAYPYDFPRDEMEFNWLRHAQKYDLPVLGICRGAQLMNIEAGGSLHKDVSKVFEKAKYPSGILANIFFRKTIFIEKDTLLFKILNCPDTRVNSMHTQSVDRPGKGLIETSREKNGVIQSLEDPQKDYYIGVQFHPELLIHRKNMRGIFRALINAASA